MGAETRAAIEAAIQELPEAQRAVMTLRDIEGLPTEEICNLLSITVTNQRVLLHRARSRVRQALERRLGGVR
jgi:RNA polymerase sigma-70 factor (ECF subfamily)